MERALACALAGLVVIGGAAASSAGAGGNAPGGERSRMLARLATSCFGEDMTQAEYEQAMELYGLFPPLIAHSPERFFTDTMVWTGDGEIGASGRAQPAQLTYSFPQDGTTWGLEPFYATGPNDLNARFTSMFGAMHVDRGRELIRQALAAFRQASGLSYTEVADDNTPMTSDSARVATRGDIRIGALPYPNETFLAYNAFPSNTGFTGTGGGDMVLNSVQFIPSRFLDATNNHRYFRNTIAHEHGHGTGAVHTTPCNGTKLMEPLLSVNFDMLSLDDLRGVARNYGDRFAGNGFFSTPHNFGNLTTPVLRSVIERGLSTNGQTGTLNSKEDWFRFQLSTAQTIVVTVTPVGHAYNTAQQSGTGCTPATGPLIDASKAGNLAIELRIFNANNIPPVMQSSNAHGPGGTETLTRAMTPGDYTIRVVDVGPSANQLVQLYDLTIRVGDALAPPTAVAGVHKRVTAGHTAYFMGNINSVANELGATIVTYDWDLDGDGEFETLNNAQPTFVYPSNGEIPVTLRVTDSNGLTDTDTIMVAVTGASGTFTVDPSSGVQGSTQAVTITGSNLTGVMSASDVTVSGTGVTVLGTPEVSPLGDQITGLSFQVSAGAFPSARNVTVQTSGGPLTSVGAFTVTPATTMAPGAFHLVSPESNETEAPRTPTFTWTASDGANSYQFLLEGDNNGDGTYETVVFEDLLVPDPMLAPPVNLPTGKWHRWSVKATNGAGTTFSTPAQAVFRTRPCYGDANHDNLVNFGDINSVLASWGAVYPPQAGGTGDADRSGFVDFDDINAVIANWNNNCQ